MKKINRISEKVSIFEVVTERTTKVGNSSHVVLPRSWLGKRVMVIKLEK